MYLAYIDDSARKAEKKHNLQVLSALVLKDEHFRQIEGAAGYTIEKIIPEGKLDEFEEFHAYQLYGGHGVFECVDQDARMTAITFLLRMISSVEIPIIYGAVDTSALRKQLYASASPIDICFRICAKGIEDWIATNDAKQFALLITDDFQQDKDLKLKLRQSFRDLRKPMRPPHYRVGEMPGMDNFSHIHDEMYFGNSKESVGLQMADLCTYFIGKHLQGGDDLAEGFYNIIKDRIVYSKIEPENSQLGVSV